MISADRQQTINACRAQPDHAVADAPDTAFSPFSGWFADGFWELLPDRVTCLLGFVAVGLILKP
ncbi:MULTISPECIES: hypothetical protein [unclassified Mesorhizobium]|uniref:hypothetical protein n=1 Tax=Mesorhizobium TaxID=68287 RepID=UPI0009FEBCA2|nr:MULTISPECIES: hypothetical protein [unclassified Mesorhizobium]